MTAPSKNHRSSKSNILPVEEEAINKISHNDSIIVKPSDKCKAFVIMEKENYINKSLDILENYEQVPTNPTPKVEAATKRLIKSVMEGKVSKSLVQSLLPQGSRTAEFYGLPKKKNIKNLHPYVPSYLRVEAPSIR